MNICTMQIGKRSFVRFLLVGGTATALHYLVIGGAVHLTSISFTAASAIGYVLSMFYNYWANSRFTFGGGHDHTKSFPRFLIISLTGLGINQSVLSLGIYLHLLPALSQVAATVVVVLWNYFLNAIWTFANKDRNL